MEFNTEDPLPFPSNNQYAVGKTRPVAWFASHCTTATKRELFVNELRLGFELR